jgi:site-specific recombinase XerD
MENTHKLTLAQVIEGYLLAANGRRLSQRTIADYSNTFRLLINYLSADIPFADITREQVNYFLANHPVSKKTIFNYHIGLSALWTWAIREEITDEHIIKKIPRARPEQPEIIPYSRDDINRMLNALTKSQSYTRPGKRESYHTLRLAERHRAIILLLLDTGIRAQELCELKIHQVDLQNQRINVWGKGAKQRVIPISAPTSQAIWKYLTKKPDATMGDPVFITRTGKSLNRHSLLTLLKNIGNRAGVTDVRVHRFRHTFAINYLRNGGDVYTLQRILGHTTLDMVKRYLAIAQADVNTAHRKASPVSNWNL